MFIKLFRDLMDQKSRTLLIVLSIAIGVVGVGAISQAKHVFIQGMSDSYSLSNPPEITLLTEGLDRSLVESVGNQPGIMTVEALRTVYSRIQPAAGSGAPGKWNDLILFARPDFTDVRLDRVVPVAGLWPPPPDGLVLEQSAVDELQLHLGDSVRIDLGQGKMRELPVVGIVRDPIRDTAYVSKRIYGYLSMQELQTWGETSSFNTLAIQVDRGEADVRHLNDVAVKTEELLKRQGVHVLSTDIPEPGKHWAYDMVTSIAFILQVFGALSLLLGMSLIVNTVSAMLIGQFRQIGVMKVLGASTAVLFVFYMGLVAVIGAVALAVGIPSALALAGVITGKSVRLLNFDRSAIGTSGNAILLQIGVGLGVPLAAAVLPIRKAVRMTEQEAIGGPRLSTAYNGASLLEAMLMRIRSLPRPLTLALRNTVRRKGRLLLTLFTLSVGGAIVLSVIGLRASIGHTIDQGMRYMNYDFQLEYPAGPKEQMEQAALSVPGVTGVESWYGASANLVRPDGSMSRAWSVTAVPAGSAYLTPTLARGSWFKSGGGNEIVLNALVLRQEPELRIGDKIQLKMGDLQQEWRIAGFAEAPKEVDGYVDEAGLTRLLNRVGQANKLNVRTDRLDRSGQSIIGDALGEKLKSRGLPAGSPHLTADLRTLQQSQYSIILLFLEMMAALLCLVAGLGLMGAMGLSVMERTREIGILRSIGASDQAIWGIVICEGAIIGLISWLFALAFSLPVSQWLCVKVGDSLFGAPMGVVFSGFGAAFWLVAAVLLAVAASFAPAWKATRISVRDALKHE